jgi:putative chitinase
MNQAQMISIEQVRHICSQLSAPRAAQIGALLSAGMEKWKLGFDEMEEFIPNIAHESGEFTIKCENMNYSAQRMAEVWPFRYAIDPNAKVKVPNALALSLHHNPLKLANLTYNGRMGNRTGTDDGFNFKGGGFAQITGRDAYTLYTSYVNKTSPIKYTIQKLADLVQTTDEWAMDSSFWFFCEFKNLEETALQDKFRDLVKRWNGGLIGLAEREKYYKRTIEVLRK